MGGPKTRVSQETFDAAVKENEDEFGMEPEEAMQSAVEEFKLQGVDLSNIATSQKGGKQSINAIRKAVECLKAASSAAGTPSDLLSSLATLEERLHEVLPESLPPVLEAAAQADAVAMLLTCCTAAEDNLDITSRSLHVLRLLLAVDSSKAAFMRADGASKLAALLTQQSSSAQLIEDVALVAEAAAKKHEDNKCSLVDSGCASQLVEGLRTEEVAASSSAVQAVCACLKSLTTADDPKPAASRAFQNSRSLAQQGAALLLLSILKRGDLTDPATVAAVCGAVKKLAANEDICKDLADEGAVQATMQVLASGLANATLVRSACSLLRQLANSDAIKADIVDAGGLELLCRAVEAHTPHAGAMEQALGLLVALTLRNPKAATRAVEVGCVDTVLEVMKVCQTGVHGKLGQWVQRQACMSIRNIVARNPELRPVVLDKGAEPLLRSAKQMFAQSCGDVGSAALRDLDIQDYNT
ncbi:hypothetical protein ABBQ38_011067 [Trebouxia sp. C0009 RCD-2024]